MTAQRADELVFSDAPLVGTPEERAMALAFKRGERDAYEAIHERYEPRVLSVCRRMLGDPHDAQEAAQEAFLRVYQGLPRFNGRYRLGAWIVRITTNVCLDQLRARSRRPADPVPREILDLECPLAEDTDPQILFLRHAEGRRVRKVLDSLPPLHRAAIVLRDFEGIAYADIAETLGITEGQVKALLHRARKGFKRSWAATVASMLLPTGLFKKWFKPWDLPSHSGNNASAVSQAAETAMSTSQQFAASASQAVNACGGALHSCSQFMADKAAPVVAAVVVGTTSMGAAVATDNEPTPRRDRQGASISSAIQTNGIQPSAAIDSLDIPKAAVAVATDSDKKLEPQVEEEPPVEEAAPPVEGPAPALAPAPEPSPSPTEEPSPPTDPVAENPAPPVEPAPPAGIPEVFAPAIGFDWGRPVSNRVPISNYAAVTCEPIAVEQRVETVVEDDDSPVYHPALLNLHAGKDVSVDLTVWKGGAEIPFSGTGELKHQSMTDGFLELEYAGDYETWNSEAENLDLPLSGPFAIRMMLDCAASTVVQETVMFGTNATPLGE